MPSPSRAMAAPSPCSSSYDGGTRRYAEPASEVDLLRQIPSPKLVTVNVGGNDTGFANVILACITAAAAWIATNHNSPTCQQEYTNPDGSNVLSNTINGLLGPITTALTDIKSAVPAGTTIVALTYPAILSSDVSISSCTLMLSDDIPWLIGLTHQLDQIIIQAARSAGVGYLDEEHAFQGHELCTSAPWAKKPDNPAQQDPSVKNNYFHPLAPGYAREAQDLRNYLTGIP